MTPLLLLHGALGSAAQFQPLLRHLPAGWPMHALNFPGHGGQPLQEPFSMPLFSDAVLQFLNAHDLPQVNIFGYSMGGYVALHFAGEHPARVKQVVTLGTKLDWSPEVAAGMTRMFDPAKIEAKVPAFANLLAQAHGPADWKQVCRYTAAFLHELGNSAGLPAEAFERIVCPVTIGWGEQDNVVTAEESCLVAGLIPLGKFRSLQETRHPIEQVDAHRLATFLMAELE